MTRREFFALASGVVAWPLAARRGVSAVGCGLEVGRQLVLPWRGAWLPGLVR